MTDTNNNLSLFVEEQIIQQKIKIPTNFVELQIPTRNNWGSTEGLDKPLCERYTFKHNNKLITLDITQELRKKLGLEHNANCSYPVYLNKELLNKLPDQGGITIDKEKDIICQQEGIIIIKNEGVQVDFTTSKITELTKQLEELNNSNEENLKVLEKVFKDKDEKQIAIIFLEEQLKQLIQQIKDLRSDLEKEVLSKRKLESDCRELERVITKLKEDEQVLLSLQHNLSELRRELGNQILTLTSERDNIQGELNNLQTELRRIRWKFLNSWFRKSEKSKKITDLKARIVRLGAELFDKDRQITNLTTKCNGLQDQITHLTTEKNDLTNEVNRLNAEKNNLQAQLTTANNLIANTQIRLNINNLNVLTQLPAGETPTTLLQRPTQAQFQEKQNRINQLNNQIISLNQKLVNANNNVDNLRIDKTRLENEVNRLNNDNSSLKIQLKQAQNDRDYYSRQVSRKDDENDSLRNQISTLNSKINSLYSELNVYKDRWNKLPAEREFVYIRDFEVHHNDTRRIWTTVGNSDRASPYSYPDSDLTHGNFGNGQIKKNGSTCADSRGGNRVSFRWFKVRGRVERVSSVNYDDNSCYY